VKADISFLPEARRAAQRSDQTANMHFLVDIATSIPQYLGCR